MGAISSTWNFESTGPYCSEVADFEPIFARSASAVTLNENSSINTNRKSTTHFPMSLRWSSYVASKQGWARDVKARDRDETETLTSQDRDETETLASPAETRPRRDVKISRRDRDETFVALETWSRRWSTSFRLIAITGLPVDVIFHVHFLAR